MLMIGKALAHLEGPRRTDRAALYTFISIRVLLTLRLILGDILKTGIDLGSGLFTFIVIVYTTELH